MDYTVNCNKNNDNKDNEIISTTHIKLLCTLTKFKCFALL